MVFFYPQSPISMATVFGDLREGRVIKSKGRDTLFVFDLRRGGGGQNLFVTKAKWYI